MNVREVLAAHGLRPSRALGQNFLNDPNTAERIVRLAEIDVGDRVVEVGPGIGALTLALAGAGADVLAVELDRHLIPALTENVAGLAVDIVNADALLVDWSELLSPGEPWAMVSNLPYNVATPVVMRALETAPMVDRFLVMVQREVGERLAALPGSKTYGAVSVRAAYYADAKVVGSVPATVFVPKPNVESVLVRLVRRPAPVAVRDPERMFALVRAGFATRRKTLRRALAPVLGDQAGPTLERAGIDPSARAETLGLEQWAHLAEVAS